MKYQNIIWIFTLIIFSLLINNLRAEDITEFGLEDIKIGDSLLKHLSKSFIEKKKTSIKVNKKKIKGHKKIYKDKNNKLYDRVVLFFNPSDPNFTITRIIGRKYFKKNINKCYDLQKTIANDLEKSLENPDKFQSGIQKLSKYPNGESYFKEIYFYLRNNSMIRIICYDYSKKDTLSKDRLSVIITSSEYFKWRKSVK